MKDSDITVVIPILNAEKVIKKCLISLQSLSSKILIIDNNSSDKSLEIISNLNLNIKIYKLNKNIGWGNSANYGIKKSRSKYSLLLNPDIYFTTKKPLLKFVRVADQISNLGMLSCLTLNENHEPENGRIPFFSKKNTDQNNKNSIPIGLTCGTNDIVYGGAIILFNTKVFLKHKGFDKNVFLYLEEDDLCLRLKKKNYINVIEPKILAVHLGSKSSSNIPNLTWWKNWHWAWSSFYFKRKYSKSLNYILEIIKKLPKVFIKTIVYSFVNKKKYFLYSGRLNGYISFLMKKKSLDNTPDPKLNNARGFFGYIKLNPNDNNTLSK
jgi:N-acetylglucosaminyl-diphospho-decaprenol L-rhamnosyltransferase